MPLHWRVRFSCSGFRVLQVSKAILKKITTKGRDLIPQSGTTYHAANGTDSNEYPFKVPTCTAALADSDVGWDGTFDANFEDFFITKIADEAAGTNKYWQLAVNFKCETLGGGRTKIQTADRVVWALIPLQQAPASDLLLLRTQVTVIDGETSEAVKGATVKDGVVRIKYPTPDTDGKARSRISKAKGGAWFIRVGKDVLSDQNYRVDTIFDVEEADRCKKKS
ncbi:hypothetical protein GALMADRAFT_1334386 [Galerina marginata CBS 339.88]|uniref:Transcobalamin-like C-terminal domain-containing protein n=1 Tax=Galerina marginata (strain CBS 339.88) TaxID=685588 RepID=A0A067T776_GALM3|nr:hypothetical protein GALMADRAFT_1334386 [Galerina marginata CBS 339.88]